MKNNFFYSISALLFAFALIAGCGGGGGSSNPVAPETSTTTSTSTSTASETATSTATNTGSDTATSTETSTGTGTSTSTETSTDTGTDTDTGTGTETSTITWTNVSSKNDIIGKWQNDREYKVDGGDVEKTWKDIGNGVPAIEFTSDEIEGIDIDGVYLSWPSKSKTVYYDKESVASDSTEIWTIDASENLDTYYIIDISLSKLNYIIIDPTTSQYKIIPYNIGITSDNGDNYIKLYDDIRPDYLILKKLP